MSLNDEEFEEGETILSFEPDHTKARVLYDAKVLQCLSEFDKKKNMKKTKYLIHFQGWNSSWDRVVPSSYVLKYSPENRFLMKKLAATAKNVKLNKSRKRQIDQILEHHFNGQVIINQDNEMEVIPGKFSSEPSEEESDVDSEIFFKKKNDSDASYGESASLTTPSVKSDCEEFDDSLEEEKQLEKYPFDEFLTKTLKKRLEDDCCAIVNDCRVPIFPAQPNVVDLLEGYIKNYVLNQLCTSEDHARPVPPSASKSDRALRRAHSSQVPRLNVALCKEVVDSLRVVFDFYLPTCLLYNSEKAVYHDYVDSCLRQHAGATSESPLSPESSLSPDTSPKLPSRKRKLSKSGEENGFGELEREDAPMETAKRVTRHSIERPKKKDDAPTGNGCSQFARQTRNTSMRQHADRLTPPPPVLSTQLSKDSSCSAMSARALPPCLFHETNAELASALDWTLLPSSRDPPHVLPCEICPAIHFLRLFVKLPSILREMAIPRRKAKELQRHVDLLIEFLSMHSDELFPDSIYSI